MDNVPNYSTQIVPLTTGLDLTTNAVLGNGSSLRDCLNREVIDRIGYKRIDGIEYYDGRVVSIDDYFTIVDTTSLSTVATNFQANDLLVISGTTEIFGKVLSVSYAAPNATIVYARINKDVEPQSGDAITVLGEANEFTLSADPASGVEADASAADSIAALNTHNAALRASVGALHDTAVGVHWYRDRLYAVVTDRSIHFTSGGSGGTEQIKPNYYIKGTTSGAEARVLSVSALTSGSWAANSAAGMLQYELLTASDFSNGEVLIYDESSSFASPITSDIATTSTSGSVVPQYASLWESRNEQQASDETASVGFTRIDHGWEIDYEDGLSDTGGFTVVSRGTDNNFSFTSSSGTTAPVTYLNGNNVVGSTFATNSINPATSERVDNGDAGWKTNASTTVFAGDAALSTALTSDDSNYAYANVWYYGASSAGSYGFTSGALAAYDKSIYGPTTTFNSRSAPSTIGTETFDSDFFSTQARAPIVLQDLSTGASALPEGSLIVGIGVSVLYDSQNYAEGAFIVDRNGTSGADIVTNTVNWVKNNLVWEAALVNSTTTTESTLLGTAQTAPIVIDTTPAGYQSSVSNNTYDDTFAFAKSLTAQTATIGGATNTFGVSGLTRNDMLDSTLGLALYAQVSGAPTYPLSPPMQNYTKGGSTTFPEYVLGLVRLKVDRIVVTLYYTTPSARYYVGDGAGNVCSIDVIYYAREDGSFAAGTATGKLQFTNIQTTSSGSKQYVETGDTLHTTEALAAAGTSPVATAASDAVYNGLPSISRINDSQSQYEMVTWNFFGREDWDGFYGANGADRGFSFARFDADGLGSDEYYIIRIITNTEDITGDKPRHVATFQNCLCFGYGFGVVRASVPGLPENFDGEFGAVEVGIGDVVTGMLPMAGNALGVFCENSIHAIVGSDSEQWNRILLAPSTGAIEYTVVDFGGFPVFCGPSGISTLEQSNKYGSFQGRRLSYPVSPWILRRMNRSGGVLLSGNGDGVRCAIPVRSTNQYWVFFEDGVVLVMTLNPDMNPSFTYSRYMLGHTGDTAQDLLSETNLNKFIVPAAISSQVDNEGKERIHISHYSNLSTLSSTYQYYIYEMNRGWGFAGQYIPEYYAVNWWHPDPFSNVLLRKIRVDGLTLGAGSSEFSTARDYGIDFNSGVASISIPETPMDLLYQDYVPGTAINSPAERGRAVAVKVAGKYLAGGSGVSTPMPPDIHQVMLLQLSPGGKVDA